MPHLRLGGSVRRAARGGALHRPLLGLGVTAGLAGALVGHGLSVVQSTSRWVSGCLVPSSEKLCPAEEPVGNHYGSIAAHDAESLYAAPGHFSGDRPIHRTIVSPSHEMSQRTMAMRAIPQAALTRSAYRVAQVPQRSRPTAPPPPAKQGGYDPLLTPLGTNQMG
jgi:hypothetical protein